MILRRLAFSKASRRTLENLRKESSETKHIGALATTLGYMPGHHVRDELTCISVPPRQEILCRNQAKAVAFHKITYETSSGV